MVLLVGEEYLNNNHTNISAITKIYPLYNTTYNNFTSTTGINSSLEMDKNVSTSEDFSQKIVSNKNEKGNCMKFHLLIFPIFLFNNFLLIILKLQLMFLVFLIFIRNSDERKQHF